MNDFKKVIHILIVAVAFAIPLSVTPLQSAENSRDCLNGVCIGDRLDQLDVDWQPIPEPVGLIKKYQNLPAETPIASIYDEFNEIFDANNQVKLELAPYIIDMQRFDKDVLKKLEKVGYFCTSTTLAGMLKIEGSEDEIWVTARIVPDESRKGHFRVVQIERIYDYMAPFLRPTDEPEIERLKQELKKVYPNLQILRNIDNLRGGSNDITLAKYYFGFKFISASNVPATLRIKDSEDIEPIDFSELKNEKCPNDW